MTSHPSRWPLALAALAAQTLLGCNSSDDATSAPPGAGTSDFQVIGSNVAPGSEWLLNQAIEIEFNEDVDFSTVSLTTIQVVDNLGVAATGSFTAPTARTVRFQPTCPTTTGGIVGALQPGTSYRLLLPDRDSGGVTVQNTAAQFLDVGLDVPFTTPASLNPADLFEDTVSGPPNVRIRGVDGEPMDSLLGSYVQFGDDPNNIEYFELDGSLTPPQGGISSLVPLNLYSRVDDQFSIVLNFDQAISASPANISAARIGLEYESQVAPGTWVRSPVTPTLIQNCTASGASLRLTPLGIVPQGTNLRVYIFPGFQDIVGQTITDAQREIARVTSTVANPGGTDLGAGSDEILETFMAGGGLSGSLEDTTFASGLPRADWSGDAAPGTLAASFAFPGTGGPGGDFDILVRSGQTVIINTNFDTLTGGPNGVPTDTVEIVGGMIDVDDFIVEPGARVVFLGSNTATLMATGDVIIEGLVSLNGGDSPGVSTLNTTDQPEAGGLGLAGGGSGGTGSYLVTESTPVGQSGEGAFQTPGRGGRGGETGFAPLGASSRNFRRGAGGGGGRLGPDVRYEFEDSSGGVGLFRCQTLVGLDAEPGFHGSLDGTGAVSQSTFAMGGPMSPVPFTDTRDDNDFFGAKLTPDGRQIVGELPSIWAGAGGGAGGDASATATFPMTPFSPLGDEKGAGGGGGAGGLLVMAVGNIEIRDGGELSADGGAGAGGENTVFFDRVGAGSGGGSGGHIVLSSASAIVIEAESSAVTTGDFYRDNPLATAHERRPLRALGGQGGVGRDNRCGSSQDGDTRWLGDAIPQDAFEGNSLLPPQGGLQFDSCNNVSAGSTQPAEGTVIGGGGDGGPGIIQLHVADPATQLLFPNRTGETYGVNLDPTRSMTPPPFGWTRPTDPVDTMIPLFGARSAAYSKWIPLGLAKRNPDGSQNDIEYFFGGTDTATGSVPRNGDFAAELDPIVPFSALSVGGALPSVDTGLATVTISGSGIDDIYKRNGALLRMFAVRVREAGSTGSDSEFTVQTAQYDPNASGTDEFALVVDPRGNELSDLIAGLGSPEVAVVPFFYRFASGGVADAFPAGTNVRISFDATVGNGLTFLPVDDPAVTFSGGDVNAFTADISDFDGTVWDYVRFQVQFDLNMTGSDIDPTAARPGIDFLRIPYRF